MREGRASSTARLIAAATVLASHERDLRALVPRGAAQWSTRFLSTCDADRRLLSTVSRAPGRRLWRALERALCPGIIRHWMPPRTI